MPTVGGDPQGNDGDRDKANGSGGGANGSNPFIRFKDHVDSKIQRGYDIWSSFLFQELPNRLDSLSRHPPPPPPPQNKDARQSDSHHNSSSNSGPPFPSRDTDSDTDSNTPSISLPHPFWESLEFERIKGVDDVYMWAAFSPYSPLHLQGMRQPIPRDPAPVHSPLSSSPPQYTFRDAFEDLLWVSAGYPLPDLEGRMVPRGGSFGLRSDAPLHVADWTARLGILGLWPPYFPNLVVPPKGLRLDHHSAEFLTFYGHRPSPFFPNFEEQLAMEAPEMGPGMMSSPWFAGRRRLLQSIENLNWGLLMWFRPAGFQWSLSMGEEVFFKRKTWKDVWEMGWNGREWTERPKGLSNGSGGEETPSKWTWSTTSAAEHGNSNATSSETTVQHEVEEDLYDSIAASDPQVAARDQQQKPNDVATVTSGSTNPETTTETIQNPDGGKTIRTIRRHEDKAKGKTEIATTTERYDAEGNLISRGKSTTSTRAWSYSSSSDGGDDSTSSSSSSSKGRWDVSLFGSWTGGSSSKGEEESREVDTATASSSARNEKTGQQQQEDNDRQKTKRGWFWT